MADRMQLLGVFSVSGGAGEGCFPSAQIVSMRDDWIFKSKLRQYSLLVFLSFRDQICVPPGISSEGVVTLIH